jgi:hypothetical protein
MWHRVRRAGLAISNLPTTLARVACLVTGEVVAYRGASTPTYRGDTPMAGRHARGGGWCGATPRPLAGTGGPRVGRRKRHVAGAAAVRDAGVQRREGAAGRGQGAAGRPGDADPEHPGGARRPDRPGTGGRGDGVQGRADQRAERTAGGELDRRFPGPGDEPAGPDRPGRRRPGPADHHAGPVRRAAGRVRRGGRDAAEPAGGDGQAAQGRGGGTRRGVGRRAFPGPVRRHRLGHPGAAQPGR